MVNENNDRRHPVSTEPTAKTTTKATATTTTPTAALATNNLDPEANLLPPADDTESHGRCVRDDAEAVVSSPESTRLSTSTPIVWEAYLAPESERIATIEVVEAVVVMDDTTDIQQSDRRKWSLFVGGSLWVGAAIVVVVLSVLSGTRSSVIDPPLSDSTTIVVTGRLQDIMEEIKRHFESPTLIQDLENTQSPQYLAALWMAEEDEHHATANLMYPLNQSSLDLLQFRQRYALTTLYYATDGDQWGNNCSFLTPSLHVCEWNCEWDSEPYDKLKTYYKDFDDFVVGDKMGALCGQPLQDEQDDLPPVWGDLVTNLVLVNNVLTKTIPDEIQGLDVLTFFYMGFVYLTGSLPLDALANTMIAKKPHLFADQLGTDHYLQTILLEETTLSGTLSSTIGKLTSLRSIWLYGNTFSGTIPSTIGLLTSLDTLDVSEALINGTLPPEIYSMSSLVTLVFDSCDLTGTIPEPNQIVGLPFLEKLQLNGNRLRGKLPKDMDIFFPNLYELYLHDNFLTGEVPSSVGELVNLKHLELNNNFLSGKLLEQPFLYKRTGLTGLLLNDNWFSGTIPTNIGLLSQLFSLQLGHQYPLNTHSAAEEQVRQFMGTIPTELGQLTIVTAVNLGGNRLTGTIPTEIAGLPLLFTLNLNHNWLTGTFPTELGFLSSIGPLELEGNSITGSLESFCSNFSGFKNEPRSSDCLEATVNCSCCNICCDQGDQCIEMQT